MNIKSKLIRKLGLLRSIAMYYWKPFGQRRLKRFYAQFIEADALCFDIGAHLGNRLDCWLQLGAKVIAVEPQPLCIQYLEKHFGDHKKVKIIPKAVAAQKGITRMYISWQVPTVSTLANKEWRSKLNERSNIEVKWNETIEVEVITLDHLIKQFGIPDFCKIDVEDFEEEVLKGLSHPIKMLSFEFFNWTPERTKECLKLINELGIYNFNIAIGESQRFKLSSWTDSNSIIDFIAKHKTQDSFSGDIYARLATLY